MPTKPLPMSLQVALIKGRTDPILFINVVLGMPLHAGQIRYIRETLKRQTKINLLTPANRWGKTALVSCLQIWFLFYKRKFHGTISEDNLAWVKSEYRTTNVAPHSALTEPVFKAIHAILTSSYPIPDGRGGLTTNKCQVEWWYLRNKTLNTPPYKQFFDNNSYIEHRSLSGAQGTPIEGKPYGLITYDEGGRSKHLQDELEGTILARLFDWDGVFHMPSTPDKTSPSILYHYKMWQDGVSHVNQTYAQEGSLTENTFFSPEQIQSEFDLYAGNPLAEQRLHGKFSFGGDTVFPVPDILACSTDDLNDGLRPEEGHRYTLGIDTAISKDEMVYTILDATEKPFKLVRLEAIKGNQRSPQMHLNKLLDLIQLYGSDGNLQILLETFNEGSARFYLDLPPYVQGMTICYGTWQPDNRHIKMDNPEPNAGRAIKKADLLITLQKLLASHELRIPSHENSYSERATSLVQQLSVYREADTKLPQDRVISLALAAYQAEIALPSEAIEYQSWSW